MNSGENYKGRFPRPSDDVIRKIRRVKAENPELSFSNLGIRFSMNYKTVAKIIRKQYPYEKEV
jgi:hypothetical protein